MLFSLNSIMAAILIFQNVNGQGCPCKCPSNINNPGGQSVQLPRLFAVRPKPITRPKITIPLFGTSGKGPCFRNHAIVKPAILPLPQYLQTTTPSNIHNVQFNPVLPSLAVQLQTSDSPVSVINLGDSNNDLSKVTKQAQNELKKSAPADAVSLALAYKNSLNDYTPKFAEDRLFYGFRKLPIESPRPVKKVYKIILPEESLYTLNGPIVELQAPEQTSADTLSEEAQEELLDLAASKESKEEVQAIHKPSLDDLGYRPAKIPSATFVEIPSVPAALTPAEIPPSSQTGNCNEGFRYGTVEIKDIFDDDLSKSPQKRLEDKSCEVEDDLLFIPATKYDKNLTGLLESLVVSSGSNSSTAGAAHNSTQ